MEPDVQPSTPSPTPNTAEQKPTPQTSDVLKPLRTYERDIAEMVRSHQVSAVNVNIAQKKKEEKLPEVERKEIQKERAQERKEILKKTQTVAQTSLLALLSVVLIVVGLLVFVLFFVFSDKPETITQTEKQEIPTATLSSDSQMDIVLGVAHQPPVSQQFAQLISSPLPENSITHVRFVVNVKDEKQEAPTSVFFDAVAPYMPGSLVRAFDTAMFAGIHTKDNKHPFFIISIDSFDKAFEGMLLWEKSMYKDFSGFIRNNTQYSSAVNEIPRTTFEDVIISNKDTRMLRDEQGNTLMLYSFINDKTLIITDNEITFKEIITRHASGSLVR